MKIIGITGHRGSGKTTIAYLLGNILESIKCGDTKDETMVLFENWYNTIKQNNNAIYDCSLNHVYFDEFGEIPKSFVAQLLSIDMSLLDNDVMKDNMYVNMSNFGLYKHEESFNVITAEDVLNNTSKKWKVCYISLREFMKCLSIDIMQKFFGTDVWLKTRCMNDSKWQTTDISWKIFSDVKTQDEIKYLKDNNGIIITTSRLSKKKQQNGISNINKIESDYSINIDNDNMFETLYNIATNIIVDK